MPLRRTETTTSLNNWDFHNHHVQVDLLGGEFVSAESTLIAAGPPRLTDIGNGDPNLTLDEGELVFPIGVLENVGISQSKQLQRLFEIGSSRSYFVPGRVVGSVTLGRVLYHGPSLLKVLYAYYKQSIGNVRFNNEAREFINMGGLEVPNPNQTLLEMTQLQSELHQVQEEPGYDNFWMNLSSDIFNQPFGLCIYFRNQVDMTVGAIYLEECYIQGHQTSVSSGSVLIMEGVSAQFDRARPVRMQIPGSGGMTAN